MWKIYLNTSLKCGSIAPEDGTEKICDIFGDKSCIALFRFENSPNDECGKYNGTWIGNENYTDAKWGKGAFFDGKSGISLTDYDLSQVKAISFHFSWNGKRGKGNWAVLLSSKWVYQKGNNIIIAIAGGKLKTYHQGNPTTISNTLEENKQYHLVVQRKIGSLYEYFLNGVKIKEEYNNNATLDVAFIGADNNGGKIDEPFTGWIDQVRLFNRHLLTEEIKILTNERF